MMTSTLTGRKLPPEGPPGYAFSRSASTALGEPLVKRHIVLRRGLGWVNGFITRRALARTRQDYDSRVLFDRTGATLSMKLPLGKDTAVGEAAAEPSGVVLEEAPSRTKTLQREVLAPPQGGGATGTSTVVVALTVARRSTTGGRVATRRG